MQKKNPRDIERALGQQYAQLLKESPASSSVYNDCKEVIQASLGVMEHYNRLSLALQKKVPAHAHASAAFF
ncbi:MAG TPA: hypothetical protein VN132_09595 [Bdellovibrio sp.]|nr:hypothetical protein [Bdellovibrio sp.]